MSFNVNSSLCSHCGACVSGCVCGLLSLSTEGVPLMDAARQAICVNCGHCATVCPEGAITLGGLDASALELVNSSVSEDNAATLLKTRRSMRNFQTASVDENLLKKAFSLVAYAPTAHNYREVSYIVINGRDKVQELLNATVEFMEEHAMYPGQTRNVRNGHDTLFRGAPCLILIHAPERVLSETDCATAAAYLELLFPSLGLGSCWAGMLIEACVHGLPKGISIPTGNKLYAALMVGTPDTSYKRVPFRSGPEVVWA